MEFLSSIVSLTADAAVTAATEAVETERLFGLDYQTLFDTAVTALNVFILFILLSYILFNPARKLLAKRQEKITAEREQAQADMETADKLKAEYEEKLRQVDKEAEAILAQARKAAMQREEKIVAEAKEEATKIIGHANAEAALEMKRVQDDVKKEIISVASVMAGKVVSQQIDTNISDALIEETLNEMGDDTWQN